MSRNIVAASTEDLFSQNENYFHGFVTETMFELFDCQEMTLRNRMLKDKDQLEKDPEHKQIIPYVIVTCPEDAQVMAYRRSHDGGESRLRNKYSIGVGGHIEEGDINESLTGTIWNAAIREITEELSLDIPGTEIEFGLEHLGYVNEDSTEVGRVHFGYVMIFRVSKEIKDKIKFAEEENLEELRWMTLPELKELNDSDFELWSQLIRPFMLLDV